MGGWGGAVSMCSDLWPPLHQQSQTEKVRERGKQAEARKVISSIVQRATSLSSRLFAQTKAATTLVLQNGAPVPGSAEKAPGHR